MERFFRQLSSPKIDGSVRDLLIDTGRNWLQVIIVIFQSSRMGYFIYYLTGRHINESKTFELDKHNQKYGEL